MYSRLSRICTWSIGSALTLLLVACGAPPDEGQRVPPVTAGMPEFSMPETNELIILPRLASIPAQLGAATALAPSTGGPGADIKLQLGSPNSVRYAIRERLAADELAALNPEHPLAQLHRYLVATYPDAAKAAAALSALQNDTSIEWVGPNRQAWLSFTALDPGYVGNPPFSKAQPATYQWGVQPSVLSLASAWNVTRGHAYLAHLDNGIKEGHEDLNNGDSWLTNFRPQFAKNFASTDVLSVDENPGLSRGHAGHGTHTAGIMAGAANDKGAIGVCPGCSLITGKLGYAAFTEATIAAGIYWAVRSGAQALSFSFGMTARDCAAPPRGDIMCAALDFASRREEIIGSAAGNYRTAVDFPASDSRVIAAGGLQADGNAWVESATMGTNYGPSLALMAPAKDIQSSVYTGYNWNPTCGDNIAGISVPDDGYGPCTGTSMAAPFITGVAGLVRSVNPLASQSSVRMAMTGTASRATSWTSTFGYGVPNPAAAIAQTLGIDPATGLARKNRRTPLFAFYTAQGRDHFYTTVPQMAMAALDGGLKPGPKPQVSPNSWTVKCPIMTSGQCGAPPFYRVDVALSPAPVVRGPDGAGSVVSGAVVRFDTADPAVVLAAPNFVESDATGIATNTMYFSRWTPLVSTNVTATVVAGDYPLKYTPLAYAPVVSGYTFPDTFARTLPRASVYLLTTEVNPVGTTPLVPLYRMSFRCGDGAEPVCTPGNPNYNPYNVSHFYTTETAGLRKFSDLGYKLDGIEGFLYPNSIPPGSQPAGTTPLCRLYNATADDYILFPGSVAGGTVQCNSPETGYSSVVSLSPWLGWVYTSP